MAVHKRPAAFDGVDGHAYSADILTDTTGDRSAPAVQASQAMHALGRIGQPGDVASLMAWLLGPDATWVTGQLYGVDGGLGTVRSK